jgi:hypothetical protein
MGITNMFNKWFEKDRYIGYLLLPIGALIGCISLFFVVLVYIRDIDYFTW